MPRLKVYRVIPDVKRFAHLDCTECTSFLEQWKFEGYKMPEESHNYADIPVPRFQAVPPSRPRPDFWSLGGTPHVIALNEKAWDVSAVYRAVLNGGQIFRVPLGRSLLYGLNVTTCMDLLRSGSKRAKDDSGLYEKYVFDESMVPNSLFTIPETCTRELLLGEGRVSRGDEFRPNYRKHGLTGLKFKLLWDSSSQD